jgi:hypothetical protein
MEPLFNSYKVSKFFATLASLDRTSQKRYAKRNEFSTRYGHCEQEVFVERTIGKWFKDKCFIWIENAETGFYQEDELNSTNQIPIKYKQVRYIQIMRPEYVLGYGNKIRVRFYDASRPSLLNNEIEIDHNVALVFLAEEITPAKFKSILKIFVCS